jgi:hypothetical protein
MMNTETLEALRGSIRKWENIAAGRAKDLGGEDCPLCQLFHRRFRSAALRSLPPCEGCPVAAATGDSNCLNTPYQTYIEVKDRYMEEELDDDAGNAALTRLAAEELQFLQSLLPAGVGAEFAATAPEVPE